MADTTKDKKKPDNSLLDIVVNVIAPVMILSFMSKEDGKLWHLGPVMAMSIALVLPIAFGIWHYIKHQKLNLFSCVGLFAILLTGLIEETQVEVRGFADDAGNLFATRIQDKGSPEIDKVSVEGKVTAVAIPIFEVFGVVVDTSSSILIDINGDEVDQNTFFSQLSVGVEVEIEEATMSFVTDVVSGGSIVIDEEDDDDSDEPSLKVNSISQALGVGTVTSPPDEIYNSSFE